MPAETGVRFVALKLNPFESERVQTPMLRTRPHHPHTTAFALSLALACLIPRADAALPPAVDGQGLPSLAPMLERVTPAVVNINSKTRVRVQNPFFDDPMFRRFFGMPGTPREQVQQSLGSGVVVDAA